MVNWSRYLESLCNAYDQWWQVYTITDVVGQKGVESEPSLLLFDFGLMVQTVERARILSNSRKGESISPLSLQESAPVREWVPGYPLQYNLLKIADNQLTVYTRRREELKGAGKTPLDYYAIAL
jgi:hypothetical protein